MLKAAYVLGVVLTMNLFAAPQQTEYEFQIENYLPPPTSSQQLNLAPSLNVNGIQNKSERTTTRIDSIRIFQIPLSIGANIGLAADHLLQQNFTRFKLSIRNGISGSLSVQPSSIQSTEDFGFVSSETSEYAARSFTFFSDISADYYLTNALFSRIQTSGSCWYSGSPDNKRTSKILRLLSQATPLNTLPDTALFVAFKSTNDYANFNGSASGKVLIGAGGLRNVTSAATALFMLDKIAEAALMHQQPLPQKIQDFAAYMDIQKSQRKFDNRKAFIRDVDTLCKYLLQKGFVYSLTPALVLEMADLWQYGFRQYREAGWEITAGLLADYSRVSSLYKMTNEQQQDTVTVHAPLTLDGVSIAGPPDSLFVSTSESEGFRRELAYGGELRFRLSQPFKRFYQFNTNAIAALRRYQINSYEKSLWSSDPLNTKSVSEHFYSLNINALSECLWYPNTRTMLRLQPSITYTFNFDYNKEITNSNGVGNSQTQNKNAYEVVGSLWGDLNYYITPQLSYSVGCNINAQILFNGDLVAAYNSNEYTNEQKLHCSFFARMNYQVF